MLMLLTILETGDMSVCVPWRNCGQYSWARLLGPGILFWGTPQNRVFVSASRSGAALQADARSY